MREKKWLSLELDGMDSKLRYKYLSGCIIPRPIALVTTVSDKGVKNAAPISFFNVLSDNPGIVGLGLESHSGGLSDTANNIQATGEFVVNLVSEEMASAMNICAREVDPEIDEIALAGLKAIASDIITPPRLFACPVAFECRRHVTLEISSSRKIVIGQILKMHLDREIIDEKTSHIRMSQMRLIGRVAGNNYVRLSDTFVLD